MGHQESPFSPFAEAPPSRKETSKKSGTQYSRDSVPVTGAKRVYGVPLEQLVIAGHSGVPRVVARLCHFIERHGMQTDGLFRTPGNQRSIAKIRADFDMYGDSNLERYKDVAAAAGCLKMFLRELPEAVVPTRFTEDFVAALREEGSPPRRCELLSALVHSLPPAHYALLRFLCSFLRRVTNFHRVSDPGSSEAARDATAAADDVLTLRLGRLHVAAAAAAAGAGCPCGRRCRSPGAPGCRRRRLVLRPARLKPARRPLLREPRLLRPAAAAAAAAAATRGFSAASGPVFGAAAPERCSEFGQLGAAPPAAPGAPAAAPFAGTGAPVFAATAAAAAAAPAGPQSAELPTTTCSVQHRQRRPASVDELAGLVAQVSIMSSMAEMMYT
ncbi:Rho GTPase-activating protein gacJJ [Amphibalanus amphitrite]|uniref:Rho GTPase-activating protein gacJJ n=1 Tax=Amphibalanus amphitrite TaxID=1232801 RepID=A0A6A4VDS4_AMPAM|nr:Rho GTPase-activating protein gacJJ [Amphibalanus amphitrite]